MEDTDEQAMAAMMGFSSFGAQDRPQKKRKYNPNADASFQQGAGRGTGGRGKKTTGSNTTPLGERAPPSTTNADEIDLDGDEDDGDAPLPGAGVGSGEGDGGLSEVQPASKNTTSDAPHIHGLPQRPAQSAVESTSGHQQVRGQHSGHHGRGQHHHAGAGSGTPWYEGYYDTLSNRNPWEKLEKGMGLSSKGTWISHEEHASTATPAVSAA